MYKFPLFIYGHVLISFHDQSFYDRSLLIQYEEQKGSRL